MSEMLPREAYTAVPETRPSEPALFDDFFATGDKTNSPFLTPKSRPWGEHLSLKAALLSGLLFLCAALLSFFPITLPLSSLLLLFVYFLAGIPKLIQSVESILSLEINIDVLMTLAAFLSILIGSGMEGALLLVLFALSGSLEEMVSAKAKGALAELHKLSPKTALVAQPGGYFLEKSLKEVERGARILVRSGEIVPLDGRVAHGTSSVGLAHLTGESLPIRVEVGDEVAAGALNMEGSLTIEVVRTGSDSSLARIIQLIIKAQSAKPKFQRTIDRIGRPYAIGVISLSLLTALLLPWLISIPYFGPGGSIYRALSLLIAASPCALIIALPIAYLSAISACARKGILLKGGVTLDALATCKAIAFDKTGTLTTGKLSCLGIDPIDEVSSEELNFALTCALSLEINAVHPIARAIHDFAQLQGASPLPLERFRSIPGYGLEGAISADGHLTELYIGHPLYLAHRLSATRLSSLDAQARSYEEGGELFSALLVGDKLYSLRFQDTPRSRIKEVLGELRDSLNLRLLMLTGDHHPNASAVASQVGITEFHANLRPEDKLSHVTRLSEEIGLAMVGDGINDAPALSRATVGISMGEVGSQTAIDASDVVLLHDNLAHLLWLFKKASSTRSIVRQNIILALAVICGASLAALLGLIPLWLAVTLHEGGTVLVGLNSLRLVR